jgi:signal transduction histidine kinase/ActR/RegA family two-component response regulator
MTKSTRRARGESLSRVLYDISQLLASAEDSDARVVRVLERLRTLVGYERSAVLEVVPGREPRLIVAASTPPEERAALTATISALLHRLSEEREPSAEGPSQHGMHLAVPLVGVDELVGVLYVQGPPGAYGERHVRRLSVIAAKLAAYLSLLRAVALATERERLLDAARRAAEAANLVKDEFLALVSHELRTPLNSILGWAETLHAKDAREAERARAFRAIERSVHAQAKLIEDLLDLSCIVKATLRLDLQTVEPAKLIREALRKLAPRAEQKSIQISASLDESVTPLVADPQRLAQIVVNLVANAIKFTPSGGRVEVRLERAELSARIRVIDNGVGIAPDVLPRLFEHFHQADTSSTRAHGGLGVGLALVKNLVSLHGGQVRADSAGNQRGSTFTVELPLGGAVAVTSPEPRAEADLGSRSLAGIRVLLVDDDRDIREVMQFVLQSRGAEVSVAASAADALAALEHSKPHVLLSDIAMPVETGYDLMRQVVARQGAAAPPAAAISTYARPKDHEDALASGFRMLLAKPIDTAALVAAVTALAKRETQSGPAARLPEAKAP